MEQELKNSIIDFWQHIPQNIDPVFLKIGPVQIYYYGLLYLLAIISVYLLSLYRLKKDNFYFSYSKAVVENFFIFIVIGVIVGSRFGYVLFYNFSYFIKRPLDIFFPFSFEGGLHYTGISGMSYHGGLIGAIAAGLVFCRRYKIDFIKFSDFIASVVPLGYTLGRLGNFVNGELFGRETSVFWGMYFSSDPSGSLRHPSQLYEALFEGIVLFFILWSIRSKGFARGKLLFFYIIGYGLVRFFIEFFRQPDEQLGYVLGPFTMGQVLCFLMVAAGLTALKVQQYLLNKSGNG
ncbi:MAG: prolipoprotein diacylglyceryl transferase [Candidatus Omnitrophica bacterium]|nr:prolipoprotein diacylglyceryl transferase [Candidatus Omnitrophota bacterium]